MEDASDTLWDCSNRDVWERVAQAVVDAAKTQERTTKIEKFEITLEAIDVDPTRIARQMNEALAVKAKVEAMSSKPSTRACTCPDARDSMGYVCYFGDVVGFCDSCGGIRRARAAVVLPEPDPITDQNGKVIGEAFSFPTRHSPAEMAAVSAAIMDRMKSDKDKVLRVLGTETIPAPAEATATANSNDEPAGPRECKNDECKTMSMHARLHTSGLCMGCFDRGVVIANEGE
jgi:hypothetical protein